MGEVVAFPPRAEPEVDPVPARNRVGLAEARAALRRGRARALEHATDHVEGAEVPTGSDEPTGPSGIGRLDRPADGGGR